ncbi:N-acetylmuramoyl-L-alanine amidase [Sorangium sp. So ce321]|uniref:N-acetylmuramoyl-L-alanine amidase n=1 Tax=Sorangium sp. So ce321 TaxID=3133300 RepID=UPI003F5E8654
MSDAKDEASAEARSDVEGARVELSATVPQGPCADVGGESGRPGTKKTSTTVDTVAIIKAAMADPLLRGIPIHWEDGWEERANDEGPLVPRGLVLHHTGTPDPDKTKDYPTLNVIINGHGGLPGPLANFGLGRFGDIYVIAAGCATHAGWTKGFNGLEGNDSVWGIEAENDGDEEAWKPFVQTYVYPRLAAAIARATGFEADMICSHKEWRPEAITKGGVTQDAKSDPKDIADNMNGFRSLVRDLLLNGPQPRPIKSMIAPSDYSDGTSWTQGFGFFDGSPFVYLKGGGSGAFVYRFDLPDYHVEDSQASVIATLASADVAAGSEVSLIVNGVPQGTQHVQASDPGSGGTQYQWLLPEAAFNPNSTNVIEFRVLADAQLRNGLSIFNRVVAPIAGSEIRVSIPFEQLLPTQPTYDAAFLSQSVPTLMIAGGAYAVSVTMRNIGDQVWRPGRIRLRSEQPADNLTWGLNRVDLPDGANVDPQSDVTFHFNVVAPQTLGEHLFRWGMIREGVRPFGQRNAAVNVMVAKEALFVRQSVPATIVAGTTQPASITFRNIGTVPWTRGASFRLGSQGPADNTLWGTHRVELPHDVPPGAEVTFHFSIKAPLTVGKHNFQWQVLRELVSWLGQPSPAFEVRVMPALTKAAVFVSQSVANPIPPGAVQVVAVTMRNVGTETWTAGAQFKLGSQNPTDNVRWGTSRVPVPRDVPPNAEVTFTFGIAAREAAGTWNFQWQMLQEGSAWFGQITPNVEVNIAPLQAPLLDLCFLKTTNVAQGKVEVFTATSSSGHAAGLSSLTRFSSADAGDGWVGMHRNGNIYLVKTRNTGSRKVEVLTATRSSGYLEGLSAVTRFDASDGANGRFGVLPNGDLYFVKEKNTGTGTIEAFTALGPTYSTGLSTRTRFAAAEAGNGVFGMLQTSDVYFVKTRNTGSGKVEVLTATSASGYTAGVHAITRFAAGDADNGTFGVLANGDVYFVKTRNTASGKIEVFTATRASNYASGLSVASRFGSGDGASGVWGVV